MMAYTGFSVVPGLALTITAPRTPREQAGIDRAIARSAQRFARALMRGRRTVPPLTQFLVFRLVRSAYRAAPDESMKDVRYFRENGWFLSPYYYPVRWSALRWALGGLMDGLGARMAISRRKQLMAMKSSAQPSPGDSTT
jgi:hypothetical protein